MWQSIGFEIIMFNYPLDFKIKVDGLDPSIWLNGWIQSNPLTNFFTNGWIGWINFSMDWMDNGQTDNIDTPNSNKLIFFCNTCILNTQCWEIAGL
jgi:hypothetical protein